LYPFFSFAVIVDYGDAILGFQA